MDRRWVFLGMALAIVIPTLYPVHFPTKVDERVQSLYDRIDQLEAGDTVFVSADFDPASRPELEPFFRANLHHMFSRDVNIVIGSLWPFAPPLVTPMIEDLATQHGGVYGEDYAFLGFKLGNELAIKMIGDDILKAFPVDSRENVTADLPIMSGIRQAQDFELIVSVSAGFPGTREYVLQIQGQYDLEIASSTTAVSTPDYVPFYKAGQLFGLAGGMPGSAHYEQLVYRDYPVEGVRMMATQALDVLNLGHLYIIILIVFGNIAFFLTREVEE
tara:strand:- start:23 stop:841 length:819 start_codon:yes stop_codon:yes gene_type:complete